MREDNTAMALPIEDLRDGLTEAERAERDLRALIEVEPAPCPSLSAFAVGCMVRAVGGDIPIEALAPGDEIETLEDGVVCVLSVGEAEPPTEAPVILPLGVLGARRETAFGPGRRLFHRSGAADLLFGAPEVLIEARDLPAISGARRGDWRRCGPAFALSLERPALIRVDGVVTECGRAPAYAAARPVLRPMEAAALLSFALRR